MSFEIGPRLLAIRNQRKFSQQKMADAIGMTLRGYQALEYGEKDPSLQTLIKICDGLDVSPNELLGVSAIPSADESTQIIELLMAWSKASKSRRNQAMEILQGEAETVDTKSKA